ncbi:MAG: serine/threonine protein kinase [Alphaproteobacteria bacterium]|nr:serine/threonine protein kinase [Alphaproteobacteria bacterium]MCB9793038.1 serine/threonine protein kinase [Alphaproteobacteria bacterium]
MTPEQFKRAYALFADLVDLPEAERAEALEACRASEPELIGLIEDMLSRDSGPPEGMNTLAGARSEALIADAVRALPESLAGLRVIRELGRGGMGVVYEAQQEVPRRRVALKTLPPLRETPELVAHLRRELEALARVRHPGVPAVYQLLEHDGLPVLAMELVRGRPLAETALGASPEERLRALIAVTEVLAAAHALGVVHRDVKPDNVLVDEQGQVKVLDFGIAATEGEVLAPAGTPTWCAPEQLRGGQVSPATDVYGLGALGWFLWTGVAPRAHADGPLPRPDAMPVPLHAVLLRALSEAPGDRYADAADLLEDLRAVAEHRVVRPLARSPLAHGRALWGRHRLALSLLFLPLALVVAGLLEAAWEARAREAQAQRELAGLQALAETLDEEALTRAFEALVRAPELAGTWGLHEAWTWWDARAPSVEAASMTWATALDEDTRDQALRRLAQRLAAAERWDALERVLEALPAGALPEERLSLALHQMQLEAARPLLAPSLWPLLDALGQARPVADQRWQRLTHVGLAWVEPEHTLQLVDRAGEERAWSFPGRQLKAIHSTPDGALWFVAKGRESLDVYTLAPGEAAPRVVERLSASLDRIRFLDVDGDGVPERYHMGPMGTPTLRVAEPPEAPSAPLPGLDLPAAGVRARELVDLDGYAALSVQGGEVSGVVALRGLPERAEWLGWVRAKRPALRRHGERLLLLGSTSEDPEEGAIAPRMALAELELREDIGLREVQGVDVFVRDLLSVDLRGDGHPFLVLHGRDGALVEAPDGARAWLPDLRVEGLGQLDADPGEELLVGWQDRLWTLGADGAPPLPARETQASVAPTPPPASLRGELRRTWTRLEQLVSLGLTQEAAANFERLGVRPGPSGVAALRRALTLYEEAEASLRVARLLAAHALDDAARAEVEAALLSAHDREGLAQLSGSAPPEQVRLDGFVHLRPPLRLPAPEGAAPLGDEGLVELRLRGPDRVGLELPLVWDGEGVAVDLELEVSELDWATRVELELAGEGWSARAAISRGGRAVYQRDYWSWHCDAGPEETMDRGGPFQEGRARMGLSWLQGAGGLRCEVDGQRRVLAPERGPPPGPLTLRVRVESAVQGAARLQVRSITLQGARPAPPEGRDDGLAMLLGDLDAARRLAEGSDPLSAQEARRVLGLPPDPRAPWAALLRLHPERWLRLAEDALGEAWLEALVEAWGQSMGGDDPWAFDTLAGLTLPPIPAGDPAANRLRLARWEGLLRAQRYGDVERELAPLRARGLPGAWRLTALLRLSQGDTEAATLAALRWLEDSPSPLQAMGEAMGDPRLRPLIQAAGAAPPELE